MARITVVQAGLIIDLIKLGRDMYREHKGSVVEGFPEEEDEMTLEQYVLLSGNEIFGKLFLGKTPEEIDRELEGTTPDDPVDEMGKEGGEGKA